MDSGGNSIIFDERTISKILECKTHLYVFFINYDILFFVI